MLHPHNPHFQGWNTIFRINGGTIHKIGKYVVASADTRRKLNGRVWASGGGACSRGYCAKMVRPCLRTTRIRLVFYEEIVSTFYIGLLRATLVFVPTCSSSLFFSLSLLWFERDSFDNKSDFQAWGFCFSLEMVGEVVS